MGQVTNLDTNCSIFLQCGCTQEVIVFEYDHSDQLASVAIYETKSSYNNKLSLWQRIRYCWRCLTTGYVYHDQIMLNNKHLKELKTFLGSLDL